MKRTGLLLALLAAACGGTEPGAPPMDAPLAQPDAGLDAGVAPPVDAPAAPDAAPPSGDILQDLQSIPGLEVTERSTRLSGYRFFSLVYEQPVDHHDPGGPKFAQRITLLHKGYDEPTVLVTNGYFVLTSDGRYEPTQLVGGNQVAVEHRWFVPSRPEPADWSKLDIWQAATDHHRIVQAFRWIYPGRWINTGASKSGMAAVYHRRFYPDDVDGTVAYVAPLSFAAGDERYVTFVENAGPSADCRQKLREFQRTVLKKRAAMTAMMLDTGSEYDILGVDKALEHATLELPFALWQYGSATQCSRIPDPTATDAAVFDFLDDISDVRAYGDREIERFGPYYFQAAHQLGFPRINEEHVADLLDYPGTDVASQYVPGLEPVYDPEVMRDIDTWVRTSGRSLLFIYGEYDPWSAGAFELGDAVDSLKLVVPQGNHGANIGDLTEADRQLALDRLSDWLDLDAAKPLRPGPFEDETLVEPRRRPL